MPVPFRGEVPKAQKLPACDEHGNCIACGYPSGGHGWECITYYMNEVQRSYARQLETVTRLLTDVTLGKQIPTLRASLVLEEIRGIQNIIKTMSV